MKLGGERLRAQESVSKCLQCEISDQLYKRGVGAFYSPQENLAVGVSEIWTCPGRGPDMSGQPLWKPAWGPDMSSPGLSR
jgi:hypothetical protein